MNVTSIQSNIYYIKNKVYKIESFISSCYGLSWNRSRDHACKYIGI